MSGHLKATADTVAVVGGYASALDYAPVIAAIASTVYLVLRIFFLLKDRWFKPEEDQ